MPLEDLIELGYEISRPPENLTPLSGPMVWGHGRQWNLQSGDDEEPIVAEVRNHHALVEKMEQAQAYFADNYKNWSTMTAQQKDAANRQAQRALRNLIQYIRSDLSSEGD